MHLAGGAAIAYLASVCLRAAKPSREARSPALVLIVATFFAAVLWEVSEFALYELTGAPEFLGMADTLGDVVTGLVCAAAFAYGARAA